jgi:hypothetical protein
MNTGVQDAFNLAWKLSLSLTYPSVPSTLLDSYETERIPVVRDMLFRTTDILKQVKTYRADGADSNDVRHVRRPQILFQLGVNYRWSSIVVDEQPKEEGEEEVSAAYGSQNSNTLRAGDRAPNSPGLIGEDKKTLFDIFRPTRHTVLLFSHDQETVKALKKAPAGSVHIVRVVSKGETAGSGHDTVFIDSDGYARKIYSPTANGFQTFIIRPDGVVGAIVKTVGGVEKYLKGVFGL